MRNVYFLVEGQHDCAVLDVMLRRLGLDRVEKYEEVPSYWRRLIPTQFPHKGDLRKRVPVPYFYCTATVSVAVREAEGLDNLVSVLDDDLKELSPELDGLGVLLDADGGVAEDVWRGLGQRLRTQFPSLAWGSAPGDVPNGPHRAGMFVFPDNRRSGTLEDLLCACGQASYPRLFDKSEAYIVAIQEELKSTLPSPGDRKEFKKPAGPKKAQLATMAAVLRPGKSIQTTLLDNDWLKSDAAYNLSEVQSLVGFVQRLVG